MDIQVLNEIANQIRPASISQARASVSLNAQPTALKEKPAPDPVNPASPPIENSQEQIQASVAPEISSVARAASSYSAVVGEGLNSDELNAIQDLSGRVRTAVSEFLSQPSLEEAENAAAVVASNPEAVQDLISIVEQAVSATLNIPEIEDEVIVSGNTTNEVELAGIPGSDHLISLERITNGAIYDDPAPVIASRPAVANVPESGNTRDGNPVTVEEVPETSRGDFTVTAASLSLQSLPVGENVQVNDPVFQAESVAVAQPVSTVVSPEMQEVPADEDIQVEIPVSRTVAAPSQESVDRPDAVAPNPQQVPVSPVESVPAVQAESPGVGTPSEVQGVPSAENTQVETRRAVASPQQESVGLPETVTSNPQEVPAIAASPVLQNTQVQNAEAGNPDNIPAPPPVDHGQGLESGQTSTVTPMGEVTLPEGASSQAASAQSNPQPVPSSQPGFAQSNDLFAQERELVNPENIRNANELVNSVVDNEFTSEAKKIFSEPKVIRTVADLAEFILERLQEIIATKRLQSQSSDEIAIS